MSNRVRKLVVPTIMTAVMLVVCIKAGLWQMQRRVWKEQLLANLAAPVLQLPQPVELTPDLELRRVAFFCGSGFQNIRLIDYSKYTAFNHFYIKCIDRNSFSFVIDIGDTAINDDSIAKQKYVGTVHVWQPQRWYDRIAGVDKITREEFGPLVSTSPFFIKLGPPPNPDNISNPHFGYVLQWFSFAGILAVIYGMYARRVWRETPPPTGEGDRT
jgi:surfeit locus 1 family protein